METVLLKRSHEDLFLEQGWLLALGFAQGWACFRIAHKEWSRLKPYSLGAVAALGNLATADDLWDAASRRYLEPFDNQLIYHTFWGVTPPRARIFTEYPPRAALGSMVNVARTTDGEVGYIDGDDSPFDGPFSLDTELLAVKEGYPQVQAYNPLNDAMYNVMMHFAQRHYRYTIIKNRELIKEMLIGNRRVKKFTMGRAWPDAMSIPDWLKKAVTDDLLKYSLTVMEEGGGS